MAAAPPTIDLDSLKLDDLYEMLGTYVTIERETEHAFLNTAEFLDVRRFKAVLKKPLVLRRAGKRYFGLLEDALYRILCGDESDPKLARRLRELSDQGAAAVVGAIAAHIAAELQVPQDIALSLALVLAKLFPKWGREDACEKWTKARSRRGRRITLATRGLRRNISVTRQIR